MGLARPRRRRRNEPRRGHCLRLRARPPLRIDATVGGHGAFTPFESAHEMGHPGDVRRDVPPYRRLIGERTPISSAGARKIHRLMMKALELGVPIVSFLSSPGISITEGLASGDEYT